MEGYFQRLVVLIITSDDKLLLRLAETRHFQSHKLTLSVSHQE